MSERTVEKIWYTRCPVPTASSLAHDLGILNEEFAGDVDVAALNDVTDPVLRAAHYDHGLDALIREGGNVPALWARSEGRETRLLALTWIDEYQAVLARPGSTILEPADLAGRRLGVPRHGYLPVDFWAAMSLRGYEAALSLAGLTLGDVRLVDVPCTRGSGSPWGAGALERGDVDAIYAKGAPGVELAWSLGLGEVVEFGSHRDTPLRVNNGTPRTVTVDAWLLETRPDLVTRYLVALLRAAERAAGDPESVARVLASETHAEGFGVSRAYGREPGESMRPGLEPGWLSALEEQKGFLYRKGFMKEDFALDGWVSAGPLEAARRMVAGSGRSFQETKSS